MAVHLMVWEKVKPQIEVLQFTKRLTKEKSFFIYYGSFHNQNLMHLYKSKRIIHHMLTCDVLS